MTIPIYLNVDSGTSCNVLVLIRSSGEEPREDPDAMLEHLILIDRPNGLTPKGVEEEDGEAIVDTL